jgi:hypothetical protein
VPAEEVGLAVLIAVVIAAVLWLWSRLESRLNIGVLEGKMVFLMKSYRNAPPRAMLAMLVLCTAGCSTVSPATDRTFVEQINEETRRHDAMVDRQELAGKSQIYIVESTRKDRGFRKEIERNLKGRGFRITSGPAERLEGQSEMYLVYEDRWSWDMMMYPRRVNLAIYDARTDVLLGSAEFKNSAFHTFADPAWITDELLGRIFGETEPDGVTNGSRP